MVHVYGLSYDLVVIDGPFHHEVNPKQLITFGDETMGVRVRFTYAPNKQSGSVWRGSIEQIEEGVPMFPVSIEAADPHGYPDPQSYSVKFNIDCPNRTPIYVGKKDVTDMLWGDKV